MEQNQLWANIAIQQKSMYFLSAKFHHPFDKSKCCQILTIALVHLTKFMKINVRIYFRVSNRAACEVGLPSFDISAASAIHVYIH